MRAVPGLRRMFEVCVQKASAVALHCDDGGGADARERHGDDDGGDDEQQLQPAAAYWH